MRKLRVTVKNRKSEEMFIKECMKDKGRDLNFLDENRHSIVLEGLSMKNGLKHAIFDNPSGVYTGDWKDDEKAGFGVYVSSTGKMQYRGQWAKNKFNGFGILSKKDENGLYQIEYDGLFKDGKFSNVGRLFLKDGSYYEGEFKDGQPEGMGKMWYSDGSYYEGTWKKGFAEGYGSCIYPNGNRYEGEWHKGKKHGRGVKIYLNKGQKQTGVWKTNACLTSTITDISFKQSTIEPVECPIPQLYLKHADQLLEEWEERMLATLRAEIEEDTDVVQETSTLEFDVKCPKNCISEAK